MRRLLLSTLVAATCAGYGCVSLSPRAKTIVFTSKADIGKCRFLKVVYGTGASKREVALNDAANVSATHVVVLYEGTGKVTMDAFDCTRPPLTVAKKPEAKPKKAAKPEASAKTPPSSGPPKGAPPPPASEPSSDDWVVAVMDVQTVTKGRGRLGKDLMRNIGDQLRIFIAEHGVRTIDRNAQSKEQLALVKSESYKSCYDNSCQIELGKALAASHILKSNVTQFGSLCVLNGELIHLRAEVATAAASSRGSCEAEGFLQMTENVARALVDKR